MIISALQTRGTHVHAQAEIIIIFRCSRQRLHTAFNVNTNASHNEKTFGNFIISYSKDLIEQANGTEIGHSQRLMSIVAGCCYCAMQISRKYQCKTLFKANSSSLFL